MKALLLSLKLLSGKLRYVPEQAHVRVHQIWMGDRADNAWAASYSAQADEQEFAR